MAATLTAVFIASCGGSPAPQPQAIHASLVIPPAGYVLLQEPLEVSFDRNVKEMGSVSVTPTTTVTTTRQGRKLMITPQDGWLPGTSYQLTLVGVTSTEGARLKAFSATFRTQPRHGVAGFQVGGQSVTGEPIIPPGAHVTINFTDPVNVATSMPTVNGQPLQPTSFKWAADGKSVEIAASQLPYQKYVYGLGGQPATANGETLTDLSTITVHPVPVEPSNETSAIPAGFKTIPPLQIVVEDSGDARPQSGFQKADMVFEYISEFSINRMTALYFNHVADNVGPVRSCRTINALLAFAFQGILMCSGVANGTQHYIPGGGGHGTKPAPVVIEDLGARADFYRSASRGAPHNLFTSNTLAEGLRGQINAGDPSTSYIVDAQHADNPLGQPAEPPAVGLHGVTYAFDGASQQYLRFERGAPFGDAATGSQLKVKNIAVVHVPFHYTDWSEDGCCAYSVWYEMLGTGHAEVYSDGRLVQATWHMGNPGQVYMDNNTPIYFTDDDTGRFIEMNTGLTWIHVVGNGQNG